MFFDTHLHLIYPDRLSYPWLKSVPALNMPSTFDTYMQKARRLGIQHDCLHMEVDIAPAQIPQEPELVAELIPMASTLADHCPDVHFVLGHCGILDITSEVLLPWQENIIELAKRANVTAKISGIIWRSDSPVCTLGGGPKHGLPPLMRAPQAEPPRPAINFIPTTPARSGGFSFNSRPAYDTQPKPENQELS